MTDKTKEFIDKAIQIHGYKYDYSKVEYINSKTKVQIICKEHGGFLQNPSKHLQKQGCCKCGGHIKLSNQDFIDKAIQMHGDKYDYSKVKYINSQTKIIITCKIHGDYLQVPNSHLQGCGCINCGNKQRLSNDEFINKAKEIHMDKYDYSKVEYFNSNTKVQIICKEHGEFSITPHVHLSGYGGCPICATEIIKQKKTSNTQEFIEKSKLKHGDKYDYSNSIYTGCFNKLIIICKEHGKFEQQPNNHLYGKGCMKCSNEKTTEKKRMTNDEFINKSKEIHGDKYDYSKTEYGKNSNDKVKIICSIHGEFLQAPNHHLQKRGCPKCRYENIKHKLTSNTELFIEKSKKIYGDKYDYSKTKYISSNTNVIITCKEHGEFYIRPNNHINSNQSCQKCQTKKQYSKSSIKWLNFIQKKNNIYIQHAENDNEYLIPNTRFHVDGYCKETNTIYEFHGDLWHGNLKLYDKNNTSYFGVKYGELYQKTLEREQLIRDLGYNLVVMWEYDWNKINKSIKILQRKFRNSKLH